MGNDKRAYRRFRGNKLLESHDGQLLFRYAEKNSLIQALAGDYELLMMDEPFTYFDIITQVKLIDILTNMFQC